MLQILLPACQRVCRMLKHACKPSTRSAAVGAAIVLLLGGDRAAHVHLVLAGGAPLKRHAFRHRVSGLGRPGPGTTFPAAVVTWFFPRVGGTWLVAGSVASMLSLIILEGGVTPSFFPLLWMIAGPMAALGIGFLLMRP